ncbi:MAG: AAA family ATPase [Algicola sp.]|nr:AAA family ATPase [Algicola sp.]
MSSNVFITKIEVKDHPYIDPVSIELSTDKKRSLIITGKNGTGKTTLLQQVSGHLDHLLNGIYPITDERYDNSWVTFRLDSTSPPQQNVYNPSTLTVAIFSAKRKANLSKVTAIKAPQAEEIGVRQSASDQFLQYLVNRKSQQAFATTEGEDAKAANIKNWFDNLNNYFSDIFEKPVKFKFNSDKLAFTLIDKQNKVIDLNLLSDGYSAIIHIFTDIIMRMEVHKFGDYSQNGIVLIDEVETHLHVALQKQILPLLMTFFPNIQFIVTTHSPFVLSSVEDVLIYDMERHELIDQEADLWQYSYEALVEGYFETEKFSLVLKKKIARYKTLVSQTSLEREEKKELRQLEKTLSNVPTYKNQAIERELKTLGLK